MAIIVLQMTDAGLAAVQAASGTDPVSITEVALTATPFDYAPTLEALPGEFKRLPVAGGIAAAPNVTHLTAYDTSGDDWAATGLGLFLEDGTLFAVHASDAAFMSKVSLAFGLLVFDIAFEADLAANIEYGNAVFAYPAATEETPGVAEIATQEEVDGEEDDQRIVTPLKLGARLAALLAPIADAIDALGGSLAALLADVWRPSNDGADSGLDADLLDGQHGVWFAPPGLVASFAVSAAPAGWLKCNGAAVSRVDYANLFAAIGTAFGAGDGALTFNLPDLRGEFVRGWDDARGVDADRAIGSAQAGDLAAHEHLIAAAVQSGGILTGANYVAVEGTAGGDTQYILHNSVTPPTLGRTSSTGGSETRPRNVALLYCIKI